MALAAHDDEDDERQPPAAARQGNPQHVATPGFAAARGERRTRSSKYRNPQGVRERGRRGHDRSADNAVRWPAPPRHPAPLSAPRPRSSRRSGHTGCSSAFGGCTISKRTEPALSARSPRRVFWRLADECRVLGLVHVVITVELCELHFPTCGAVSTRRRSSATFDSCCASSVFDPRFRCPLG